MCVGFIGVRKDRFSSPRVILQSPLCLSFSLYSTSKYTTHTYIQIYIDYSFPLFLSVNSFFLYPSTGNTLCYKVITSRPLFLLSSHYHLFSFPRPSFLQIVSLYPYIQQYTFFHPRIMKVVLSLVLAAATVIATTSAETLSKRSGPAAHWDVSIFTPLPPLPFHIASFLVSHQFFPCPADRSSKPPRAFFFFWLFFVFLMFLCAQPHCPIALFSTKPFLLCT